MFRKISLVFAVLAALAIVPQAHAVAKGDMMLGVRGGVSLPMGDFGDFFSTGFLGGADFTYVINPKFGIGVDGSYVMNSAKDEVLVPGEELEQSIMQFGAHAKYFFPTEGSTVPYIVGGIGMFNGQLDATPDDPFISEESSSEFGGRIGLGANFKAGEKLLINLEGNFNHIATEDTSTQYISILGGIVFPLGGGGQ